MPANHSESVISRTDIPEDDVELIDLLRVIGKWKYLIIIGTAVCALAVAIISFYMQPIFQVSVVLKSGINTLDFDGKPVYSDSVEEFKTLIEGELLFKLLDHSKNSYKREASSSGAYKIIADNKINTLRILYESTDREEGVENLKDLLNLLIKRYEKRLKYLQDNYQYKLLVAKRQLEFRIEQKKFITSRLSDIQEKFDLYIQEIGPLNESSWSKSKTQDTLLNYLSIVENVAELRRKQAQASWQIDFYNKEIADMENGMDTAKAIKVVQPPAASQKPIKPKKTLIVIFGTIVGLFVTLFISFLVEYISKNMKKKL